MLTHDERIMTPQTSIFVIHAVEDTPICELLVAHLAPLGQLYPLILHTNHQAPPGTDVEEFILYRLKVADIVLILVSADFLNSKQCYYYYDLASRQDAAIVPIIGRACHWQPHSMMRYQVLPTTGEALQRSNEKPNEDLLTSIARHLEAIILDRVANLPSSGTLRLYYEPRPEEGPIIPVVPPPSSPLKIVKMTEKEARPFPIWVCTLMNRSGRSQVIIYLHYDVIGYGDNRSIPQTRVLHPLAAWDVELPSHRGRFTYTPDDPILVANDDAATISIRFFHNRNGAKMSPKELGYVLQLRFVTDEGFAASTRIEL